MEWPWGRLSSKPIAPLTDRGSQTCHFTRKVAAEAREVAAAALSSKSFQLPVPLQLPPKGSWHLAAALGQGGYLSGGLSFHWKKKTQCFSTREMGAPQCPHARARQSLGWHCEGPRAGRYFQRHRETSARLSSVPGHPKCSLHKDTDSAHPFMLQGATSSPPTVSTATPAQQPAACHAQATSALFCVSVSRKDKDMVISTQLLQLHTWLLERKE